MSIIKGNFDKKRRSMEFIDREQGEKSGIFKEHAPPHRPPPPHRGPQQLAISTRHQTKKTNVSWLIKKQLFIYFDLLRILHCLLFDCMSELQPQTSVERMRPSKISYGIRLLGMGMKLLLACEISMERRRERRNTLNRNANCIWLNFARIVETT